MGAAFLSESSAACATSGALNAAAIIAAIIHRVRIIILLEVELPVGNGLIRGLSQCEIKQAIQHSSFLLRRGMALGAAADSSTEMTT
jgi:hypothetical protein